MDLGNNKVCEVEVECLKSGETKLIFHENGIVNELIYKKDGSL